MCQKFSRDFAAIRYKCNTIYCNELSLHGCGGGGKVQLLLLLLLSSLDNASKRGNEKDIFRPCASIFTSATLYCRLPPPPHSILCKKGIDIREVKENVKSGIEWRLYHMLTVHMDSTLNLKALP